MPKCKIIVAALLLANVAHASATFDVTGSTVSATTTCTVHPFGVQAALSNAANIQGVTLGADASAAGWTLETNANGPNGTFIAQAIGLTALGGSGSVFEVDGCSWEVVEGHTLGRDLSWIYTDCEYFYQGFVFTGAGSEACDTQGGGGSKATDSWSIVKTLYR